MIEQFLQEEENNMRNDESVTVKEEVDHDVSVDDEIDLMEAVGTPTKQ